MVRTKALLRGHTLFRRRLAVQLAQEKNHMRNQMLNESLQRAVELRISLFGARWPAAAEFLRWPHVRMHLPRQSILRGFMVALLLTPWVRGEAQDNSRSQSEKITETHEGSAALVAGRYYHQIGTDWMMYLTLNTNATYVAELGGMASGQCQGTWRVEDKHIRLSLPEKKNSASVSLEGFRGIEAVKSGTNWVLVPAYKRELYEKQGVRQDTCFQKTKRQR
jgi:hypothetical protein